MQSAKHQSGTVLIVVIMLLLLASVLTFFTLNVGVFEQQTSGNDLKSKMVSEVADAGLSQGAEYIHQNYSFLTDASKWRHCLATETAFPCGSVPASRRATMYVWKGGGFDFNGNGAVQGWETHMLPIVTSPAGAFTAAGNGFAIEHGVGAVLCRVQYKPNTTAPTVCANAGTASASPTSIVTLVSVAYIPGEGARSTVTQSFGTYNLLNNIVNSPPILASGSVDVTGGLQVVTNPNAGGTGVPVSVWTRKAVNKTGTSNTCYYNEFLHSSSGGTNGTVYNDTSGTGGTNASPDFPLCDNCGCNGADSLSFDNSGNSAQNGIDILQNSGLNSNYSAALQPGYANYDVKPTEFPCDLFQQVFGVQAWADLDGDSFCEKKLMTIYKDPGGTSHTIGVDEDFLFTNAIIVNPTVANTWYTTAQQDTINNYPSSAYSGLIWCQQNCGIGSNQQLGTAAGPVVLVIDDATSNGVAVNGKVFGLIFVRTLAGGATVTPSAGYTMSTSEIATGGNGNMAMHAGAIVYGAIVVQGTMQKANGTASVVYNGDVLGNILKNPANNKFGGLQGSWSDRTSY
jgi:hypothetical protein